MYRGGELDLGSWEVRSQFGLVSGQLDYWARGAGHEFGPILLVSPMGNN